MTSGECIYGKAIDCMSMMALERDNCRRFSVIEEFCVTGKSLWCTLYHGWKWACNGMLN